MSCRMGERERCADPGPYVCGFRSVFARNALFLLFLDRVHTSLPSKVENRVALNRFFSVFTRNGTTNTSASDALSTLTVEPSVESSASPVVLQPYLHPEVSSSGACCILIRLSTQRLLCIVQLVLVSSSPYIDFIDRYGEPLAHIEGACCSHYGHGNIADSNNEGDGDSITASQAENKRRPLFRCCSGRLSPHIECVVRVSQLTVPTNSLLGMVVGR